MKNVWILKILLNFYAKETQIKQFSTAVLSLLEIKNSTVNNFNVFYKH